MMLVCMSDGSEIQGRGGTMEAATGRFGGSECASTRGTGSSPPCRSTDVLDRCCCQSSDLAVDGYLRTSHDAAKLAGIHRSCRLIFRQLSSSTSSSDASTMMMFCVVALSPIHAADATQLDSCMASASAVCIEHYAVFVV